MAKMSLLESYKGRLAVSESAYAKSHAGEKLSNQKKVVVAKLLENTNKYLNEAFDNSVGTQRSDMGMFRKFCLNLTTVAVPNLIAFDLVMVHPLSSISGYVAYVKYTAGSNKGETKQGDVFNDPFRLGKVDVNYSSSLVVEKVTVAEDGSATLAWAPIFTLVDKVLPKVVGNDEATIEIVDAKKGQIKVTGATGEVTIRYAYDNVVIPQNDLPIVNAEMDKIPLVAKARRIAIYYSQMAAFEAKNDYGFDLGDQLAEKAVGQLAYEIDTEITDLLIETAGDAVAELTWNKRVPQYISKAQHYEGFAEMVEIGKQIIYDKTKRFAPNYMLVASNILPILSYIKGFEAAAPATMNGPYFAGTINGLKVFVTPNIAPSTYVIGVNGSDMMSSAAVYAPYMPVVPTQLLGFADGAMSQGWSTMYALEVLNKDLVVAGKITDEAYAG